MLTKLTALLRLRSISFLFYLIFFLQKIATYSPLNWTLNLEEIHIHDKIG